MRYPAIHWYEGQFLRPQHFQAADRYWSELYHTSQQWDHPYSYGLVSFELSPEALANQQLEIRTLKARMRDGTLVSFDAGAQLDRVSLAEAFEKTSEVKVYLVVPKLRLGRSNVNSDASATPGRFTTLRLSLPDEVDGANESEIELRQLNAKLMLSTEDRTGLETLEIAQIKRASAGAARPQLDDNYIPPVISIDAWAGLGRDIVRAIYDMIGQKIEVLGEQVSSRSIGLDSRHPGDMDRIMMLSQLNEAYSTLAVIATAQGVHPLTAYTELARIVGRLSIFRPDRRVEPIPTYDHDNLAKIFKEIRIRIEHLLNAVRDFEYEQRHFVGVGMGMQVTLEPKWFNSDWQWYIGVNKGDLTPQEVRELLSSGQLDWKLGSSRQVEILFKQRAPGLELSPLDRPIRSLPAQTDWLYYQVNRNEGPAWRDVQQTQSLAMRLKDSSIVNLDKLQGERQLVISNRGRNVDLQFALFAVPSKL